MRTLKTYSALVMTGLNATVDMSEMKVEQGRWLCPCTWTRQGPPPRASLEVTTMASVQYHCPCFSTNPVPPAPNLRSSTYSFHPLHALFFCEECDAVRCNNCVSVEVSCYYCPNCLFEVPSASVRAEKNRSGLCFIVKVCLFNLHQMRSELLFMSQLSEYALCCRI